MKRYLAKSPLFAFLVFLMFGVPLTANAMRNGCVDYCAELASPAREKCDACCDKANEIKDSDKKREAGNACMDKFPAPEAPSNNSSADE